MTRRDPIDLTIRSLLQPRCLINFFCTNPMRVHIIAGPDSRMECNRVAIRAPEKSGRTRKTP